MSLAPERAAADAVRERIHAACERAGRDPAGVTLIAATKTVLPERIAAAGVADAGENRVQELLQKQSALKDEPIRWHFIGSLQRNKVRKVAGRVALIHSIDSLPLADAVNAAAHDLSVVQQVLVEVNLTGEPTKGGIGPGDLRDLLESVRPMRHLAASGLMTIPPAGDPEVARWVFRRLAEMAKEHKLSELSMGMTADFHVAIEEGATMVRVGSAIFGPRTHRP